MTKFTYDNTKNTSTMYMWFKPNCKYHLRVSYQETIDLRSRLKAADELVDKLRNLMSVYKKNL